MRCSFGSGCKSLWPGSASRCGYAHPTSIATAARSKSPPLTADGASERATLLIDWGWVYKAYLAASTAPDMVALAQRLESRFNVRFEKKIVFCGSVSSKGALALEVHIVT
jgi:hypothetical protein